MNGLVEFDNYLQVTYVHGYSVIRTVSLVVSAIYLGSRVVFLRRLSRCRKAAALLLPV